MKFFLEQCPLTFDLSSISRANAARASLSEQDRDEFLQLVFP